MMHRSPRGLGEQLREAFESAPSVKQAQAFESSPGEEKTATSEVDEIDDDGAGIPPDLGDRQPAAAVADDGEIELENINQLPEVLGIEPEQFWQLGMELDGNQGTVPFGEIKDRLQSVDAQRQELERERAQFEDEQKQFRQHAAAFGQAGAATTQRMQQAAGAIQAIHGAMPSLEAEWKAKEAQDPGKVALERQHVSDHMQKLQAEYQAALQEAEVQQKQARDAWYAEQHREMGRHVPDWLIPEKRQALEREIADFALKQYGVRPEELANSDHRTMRMILDAKAGVQARNGAKSAVSTVKSKPKVSPNRVKLKNARQKKEDTNQLVEHARSNRTRKSLIEATRGVLADAGVGLRE